jgi:hypothetical protein
LPAHNKLRPRLSPQQPAVGFLAREAGCAGELPGGFGKRTATGEHLVEELVRNFGGSVLATRFGVGSLDDDRDLAPKLTRLEFTEASPEDLLETLGELAAKRDSARAHSAVQVAEDLADAAGGLEKNERSRGASRRIEPAFACRTLSRRKPEKGKRVDRKSARDQRTEDGRWTGDRNDPKPGLDGRLHEPKAGIRKKRRPRVRDQRDRFALLQPAEKARDPPRLVVGMQRDARGTDPEVCAQSTGAPRVFACDAIHLGENATTALTDVLQVPDRGRYDVDGALPLR